MSKKRIFLLTLLAAVVFFWPQLDYQPILSQEDHGRDLYTFAQVAQGKSLYKDMWWEYGPAMPYYYAGILALWGTKLSSVLIGKFILNILGVLFFYLASCEVMSVSWAFLAACFFMLQQNDFFYTYNHTGGLVFLLLGLWLVLKYVRKRDLRHGYGALGACLMTGLVKINFGASALAATILSILIIDSLTARPHRESLLRRLKTFLLAGILLVPLAWCAIYLVLLKNLPPTEAHQCLPYLGVHKPVIISPLRSMEGYVIQNWIIFLDHWLSFLEYAILMTQKPLQLLNPDALSGLAAALVRLLMYLLTCAALLVMPCLSCLKSFEKNRAGFWTVLFILGIFFLLNSHEFLVSNVWYRSFWSQPFGLFFFFFMIASAASRAPARLRYLIGGLCLASFILTASHEWITMKNKRKNDQFLTAETGQIYVGNKADWVDTINTVTAHLNTTLKKDEPFLVLPCDSLFYFLTNRPGASRQTIFFNFIHITPEQERSVIKELTAKKANYILLSNRAKASSPEIGEFGKTYCPFLYRYVMENFEPVYRYGGDWDAPAGWADNHGVILLKRRQPLL